MQWNRVAPLALVGLLAAGCGQSKSTDAEIPVVEGMETETVEAETPEVLFDDSKIFDLIRKVDGLHQAAQTNEANQVFFDALENPEFAPAADRVSNLMLRFMLFTEQTELAKAKFLALLRTAPEQALPSRDLIYGYLLENGDKEAATDWARALLAQDLPLEMRLTAADWVVNGLLTAGDRTGAVAAAKELLQEFPVEDLASLYQRLAQNAISAGALDTAEAVYGMMTEKVTPETPKLQSAVCIVEIRLHTAKGEFAAIAEAAPSYLGKVPEMAYSQAMGAAYRAAREAGNAAALDQLTSAVLLNSAFKNTRLIPSAAREWCAVPFLDKEMGPAAYPARLSKLVDLQVQPRTIFSIFSSHFYELIDDAALLKEMMAVADRIKPLLTQEADLALFKTFDLDAAFILNDYDRAIALLEEGIPDREESWHQLSITKLKAHKALDAKEYDEAARLFREFLKLLPDEEQTDPQTGVAFTRTIIVGNNEKRIGDFMKEAGKDAEAQAAYTAAAAAYAVALADEKTSPEAKAVVRAAAQELPVALPEAPAAEAPAAEPAAEAPAAEPAAEAPAAEPAAEAPVAEAPAEPAAEAPVAEAPAEPAA